MSFITIDSGFSGSQAFLNNIPSIKYSNPEGTVFVSVSEWDSKRNKDLRNSGLVSCLIEYTHEGKRSRLTEYVASDLYQYQKESFFDQILEIVTETKYQ